jgi:UDP-3-O-[3-hydroxymyristoyl] glucosamine N-acyltransferase
MSYSLADIANKIGGVVHGDGQCEIKSIATLVTAQPGQIAFLANSKYSAQLATTNASAVIISTAEIDSCRTNALVMDNPYMGYALVAQLLDTTPKPANSIHASAVIDESAVLGENVTVAANVVIEAGVTIGNNVSIGAGSFVGLDVKIATNSIIWSNVSIYHRVEIGENCSVHANTVIGGDGFGYANDKGKWVKIPQLGTVIIGNNVEIGASTTIDRGALENTIIKDGVILDNQIQIAHNVEIGENTAIAACSVIAGSTTIGKNCIIAGLVGINGHIEVGDGCVFTGMTMVTKSMNKPGVYSSGMPCQPNKDWHKNNARIRKLDTLTKRVANIEKEITTDKS